MTTAEKIAFLQDMIADPRTPDDEKAIHRDTIARLTRSVGQNAYEVAAPASIPAMPAYVAPPPPSQRASLAQELLGTVRVERYETSKTVEIHWPDGKPVEKHTEGTCRGMFVTRLSDLSFSAKAKAGRYNDLLTTTTFMRAVGYYAGLCKFFRHQPTLAELGVDKPSKTKRDIFEMIQHEIR